MKTEGTFTTHSRTKQSPTCTFLESKGITEHWLKQEVM